MSVLQEEGAAVVPGGGPAVASSVALQVMSQLRVKVLLSLAELEGALACMVQGSEGRMVGGAQAGVVGGAWRCRPDGSGGEHAGARLQHTC